MDSILATSNTKEVRKGDISSRKKNGGELDCSVNNPTYSRYLGNIDWVLNR
jgi:hypothetical protein